MNVYGTIKSQRALGTNGQELKRGPSYQRYLSLHEIDTPRLVPSQRVLTPREDAFSGHLTFSAEDGRGCKQTNKYFGSLFTGVFLQKFYVDREFRNQLPATEEFYPILKSLLEKKLRWGTDFRFSGAATFISGLLDWTKQIFHCHQVTLRQADIWGLVAISHFPYMYPVDVWRAFCELWSPATNTLHHAGGELGISLNDLKHIAGLPILGAPYEEYLPLNEELSDESKFPPTVLELLRIHADLCHHLHKNRVFWEDWIDYFYRGRWNVVAIEKGSGTSLTDKQVVDGSSARYFERRRVKDLPPLVISVEGELAAFLALLLSRFILPQNPKVVRPETIVMACLMAQGKRISLAPTVLGHIYHGLNEMATHSPYPGRANPSFAIHFVIDWLSAYFPGLYRCHEDQEFLRDYPLLIRCAGLKGEDHNIYQARRILRHDQFVRYQTIPFGGRDGLDLVDTGDLSDSDFERLLSIRSSMLPIRMGRTLTLEPYYPNRFARQFGFDQGVPADTLQSSFTLRVRRSLKDIAESYARLFQKATGEVFRIPDWNYLGRCTRNYCTWWVAAFAPYLSQSVHEVNVTLTGRGTIPRESTFLVANMKETISEFHGIWETSRAAEPSSSETFHAPIVGSPAPVATPRGNLGSPSMFEETVKEGSKDAPIFEEVMMRNLASPVAPVKVPRRRSGNSLNDDVHFKRRKDSPTSPTSSGESSATDRDYAFGASDIRDLVNPVEQPPVDEADHAADDDSDFEVGSEYDLPFARSPSPDIESTPRAATTQVEIMPVAESQPLEEHEVRGSLCSDDQPSTEEIDYEANQELDFDVSKPPSPDRETPPLTPTQIDSQLQPLIQNPSDAVSIKKAPENLQALLPASVMGSVRGFLISGVKEVVDILSSSTSSRDLLARSSQVLDLLGMLQSVAQQAKVDLSWFVTTVEGVLHDAKASSKLEKDTDVEIVEHLSTQLAQHTSALESHQAQVPCLAQRFLDLQNRRGALLQLKKQVHEVEASIESDSATLEADNIQLQGFIKEDEEKIRLLKAELDQAGFARMTELKLIEERHRAWISELTDFSSPY